MSGPLTILHGPDLAPEKPKPGTKRRPCTWQASVRFQGAIMDKIDRIARQNHCSVADVLRSAVYAFLQEIPVPANETTMLDPTAPQSITQPHTATPYAGSGGSDQNALRASANRSLQRKSTNTQGERLVDKATAR